MPSIARAPARPPTRLNRGRSARTRPTYRRARTPAHTRRVGVQQRKADSKALEGERGLEGERARADNQRIPEGCTAASGSPGRRVAIPSARPRLIVRRDAPQKYRLGSIIVRRVVQRSRGATSTRCSSLCARPCHFYCRQRIAMGAVASKLVAAGLPVPPASFVQLLAARRTRRIGMRRRRRARFAIVFTRRAQAWRWGPPLAF